MFKRLVHGLIAAVWLRLLGFACFESSTRWDAQPVRLDWGVNPVAGDKSCSCLSGWFRASGRSIGWCENMKMACPEPMCWACRSMPKGANVKIWRCSRGLVQGLVWAILRIWWCWRVAAVPSIRNANAKDVVASALEERDSVNIGNKEALHRSVGAE